MSAIKLTIANRFGTTVVVFIRVLNTVTGLFADAAMTQSLFNTNHECTGGLNGTYGCQPSSTGTRTFFITLASGISQTVYTPTSGIFESSVIWAAAKTDVDISTNNIPLGPQRQTLFELSIVNNKIDYDVSVVDGVSCGCTASFTPTGGSVEHETGNSFQTVLAPPNGAPGFLHSKIVQVYQTYDVVLPDKFTASETNEPVGYKGVTERNLAACPGGLIAGVPAMGGSVQKYRGDHATGQHLCRSWFYEINEEASPLPAPNASSMPSYCTWLRANGVNAYCWAFDEWTCTGPECGYRANLAITPGDDQPHIDTAGLDAFALIAGPMETDFSNVFSCGRNTDIPVPTNPIPGSNPPIPTENPDIIEYWALVGSGVGCEDNKFITQPNVNFDLAEGEISIDFYDIQWLTNRSPPPNINPDPPLNPIPVPPSPTPPPSATTRSWWIVFVVLGIIFLVALIGVVIYFAVRNY